MGKMRILPTIKCVPTRANLKELRIRIDYLELTWSPWHSLSLLYRATQAEILSIHSFNFPAPLFRFCLCLLVLSIIRSWIWTALCTPIVTNGSWCFPQLRCYSRGRSYRCRVSPYSKVANFYWMANEWIGFMEVCLPVLVKRSAMTLWTNISFLRPGVVLFHPPKRFMAP